MSLTGEVSWNHHKVVRVTGGGVSAASPAAARVLQEELSRLRIGCRCFDMWLLTLRQRLLKRERQEVMSERGGATAS